MRVPFVLAKSCLWERWNSLSCTKSAFLLLIEETELTFPKLYCEVPIVIDSFSLVKLVKEVKICQ